VRVAALMAVALALGACVAGEDLAQPPRWRVEGFEALWPERGGEAAWAACGRARRTGSESWRAEPDRLVPRFARRVLGWRRPRLVGPRLPFYLEMVPGRSGTPGVSVMVERFFPDAGAMDCYWIIGVRSRGDFGRF
jgi:hypothetical protein